MGRSNNGIETLSMIPPVNKVLVANNSFPFNEETNKLLLSLDQDLINLVANHKTTVPAADLLDKSTLKIRRQNVIDSLYNKQDKQCSNCGLRFPKDDKISFDAHLDEHFRAKSELNKSRRGEYWKRREWYPKFATIKSTTEEKIVEDKENNRKEEFDQIYIHDQNLLYKSNPKYSNLKEGWYLKNASWSSSSEVIHPTCSN